jgi:hypothetical protein
MFLDGNAVIMNFPIKPRQGHRGYYLDASATFAEQNGRYISSGYELGSRGEQQCFYEGQARICDPILFYSRNTHRLCQHRQVANCYPSSAFTNRREIDREFNPGPILLLFPDFPWLLDCRRVRLMKIRESSISDETKAEFSPTGLYTTNLRYQNTSEDDYQGQGQYNLYSDQPSSPSAGNNQVDFTQLRMSFTVLCQAKDKCRCDRCVIILDEVRKPTSDSRLVLTIHRMDISQL